MHALIIEDDAITAMMIEDELRDLGYTSVDTASSEQEAIAAVARRCPDLVTSDGSLIHGSGVGAVRKIRASLSVPVIFITGDPDHARHCIPDAPIIAKPFSVSQLVAAVDMARPAACPRQ
jgi:CheY-like chemotaxis protein